MAAEGARIAPEHVPVVLGSTTDTQQRIEKPLDVADLIAQRPRCMSHGGRISKDPYTSK
jgi:hypothetical protein